MLNVAVETFRHLLEPRGVSLLSLFESREKIKLTRRRHC